MHSQASLIEARLPEGGTQLTPAKAFRLLFMRWTVDFAGSTDAVRLALQESRECISVMSMLFKMSALIAFCILAASCSEPDRVVTVTCDATPTNLMPVATELEINGQRRSLPGYLNTSTFTLGAIVELTPGGLPPKSGEMVRSQVVTALRREERDKSILRSIRMKQGLEVRIEDEFRESVRRLGLSIDNEISGNTALYIPGYSITFLPDILRAINADSGAVEMIRASREAQFAIVSGSINGDDLILFSTSRASIYPNILLLAGSYVHVSYACGAVALLRERSNEPSGVKPLVIYFTPVNYDVASARVTLDSRQMDFTKFSFHGH